MADDVQNHFSKRSAPQKLQAYPHNTHRWAVSLMAYGQSFTTLMHSTWIETSWKQGNGTNNRCGQHAILQRPWKADIKLPTGLVINQSHPDTLIPRLTLETGCLCSKLNNTGLVALRMDHPTLIKRGHGWVGNSWLIRTVTLWPLRTNAHVVLRPRITTFMSSGTPRIHHRILQKFWH